MAQAPVEDVHGIHVTEADAPRKNAVSRSGICDSSEIELWHSSITLLDDWSYLGTDEPKLGLLNVFRHIQFMRNTRWKVPLPTELKESGRSSQCLSHQAARSAVQSSLIRYFSAHVEIFPIGMQYGHIIFHLTPLCAEFGTFRTT
jgi:hypothetical protein